MKPGDLDRDLLPRAAERVGRWRRSLLGRRDQWRSSLQGVDGRSLADLDARLTRSGPLALVRDVPQVGFVVIAAVFLAGAGTAVSQEADRNRVARQASAEQQQVLNTDGEQLIGRSTLGPEVGDDTTTYAADAASSLAAAVRADKGSRVALVSLAGYRTPGQLAALTRGVQVQRVYLRAKAAGPEAAQLPVDIKGDLLGDLGRAYATAVTGRLAAQKAYQGYVDTLEVTTADEQRFKDLYVTFARATGIEAAQYKAICACVFAAIVKGTAAQLAALTARAGVRAVEVAGEGQAIEDLLVQPLLPEIKGVVPTRQASADELG